MSLDRSEIIDSLKQRLADELGALESVANQTREEVGSSETKSEGKYDTRSTEASYLARGQAWRIAGLRQLAAWFDNLTIEKTFESVEVGSLVEVTRESGGSRFIFLAPAGGLKSSVKIDGESIRVEVISQSSPMGSAMFGLKVEDYFEVESPKGPVDWEVLRIW